MNDYSNVAKYFDMASNSKHRTGRKYTHTHTHTHRHTHTHKEKDGNLVFQKNR